MRHFLTTAFFALTVTGPTFAQNYEPSYNYGNQMQQEQISQVVLPSSEVLMQDYNNKT